MLRVFKFYGSCHLIRSTMKVTRERGENERKYIMSVFLAAIHKNTLLHSRSDIVCLAYSRAPSGSLVIEILF